jgi:hypothetical protein
MIEYLGYIGGCVFLWSMYKLGKEYKEMSLKIVEKDAYIGWLRYHIELEREARLEDSGCSEEEIKSIVKLLLDVIDSDFPNLSGDK